MATDRRPSLGQPPGYEHHHDDEKRVVVEAHVHLDLGPLVSLLAEALRLLKEIRSTMAVGTEVQLAIDALRASTKDDIAAETVQFLAAVRKAVSDGLTAAQAKIEEQAALIVTLQAQIAAGQDPTETVAAIEAARLEIQAGVQGIVPDDVMPDPVPEPVPEPQPASRRR